MVHLEKKTPDWASSITGIKRRHRTIRKITRKQSANYFRLGYGFTRQKNGASNMHAVAFTSNFRVLEVQGRWSVNEQWEYLSLGQNAY